MWLVGTHPIEGMGAGGLALAGGAEAVGKLLAVVGEERADVERSLLDQACEKAAGGGGGSVLEDLDVDPTGGAIDGGKQVRALVLVGHLRQVLDIDVHKAGAYSFERL